MDSWIGSLPEGASPAAEVFAALLFAVMFLRLLRLVLRVVGLGS